MRANEEDTVNQEIAKKRLSERREQLVSQIGKIETHLAHPLEQDSQERSLQVENDEVLVALDEAGRAELDRITQALARLDTGAYGTCVDCRGPIGEGRLQAVPYAERCIECAE